jgi:hypothetical protein
MIRKRYCILIIILISVFSVGYIALKPAFNYLSRYLSKSDQVKANILVVEGWVPDYALEMIYNEFQKNGYEYIVTTGLEYYSDYYNLFTIGYLIFYPGDKLKCFDKSDQHIIEIKAFSNLDGEHFAHFNFYVNNLFISDFNAEKHKQIFQVPWLGSLKDIDSIMVEFTNDDIGDFGDVNLYVKEIIIDHKIKIPYKNNSEYDIGVLDGKHRIVNNFSSSAEFAKNRLFSLGLDSSKIIAITGKKTKINRTLASALAFHDWLKKTNKDIRGINIISMGTHARRSWMTYNKIMNDKYVIGIISLPDYKINYSRTNIHLKTLSEFLEVIYYWIILIPY